MFALSCDSGDTGEYIYGCTSPTACNFDPDATEDDGKCEWPEENYDCDGTNECDIDPTGIWRVSESNYALSEECNCGIGECEDGSYDNLSCVIFKVTDDTIIIDSCECSTETTRLGCEKDDYFYTCITNDVNFHNLLGHHYTLVIIDDTATMLKTEPIADFLFTFDLPPKNFGEGCMITSTSIFEKE